MNRCDQDNSGAKTTAKAELKRALVFLKEHHVMSLGLTDVKAPHCCSLMYAHRGFTLYWLSDPQTRHSTIIDDREGEVPAMITVAPDCSHYKDVRGLQLTGHAIRVRNFKEISVALIMLQRRYSLPVEMGRQASALASAMLKARVYRFTSQKAVFIDNAAGFGAKSQFTTEELLGVSE
jgi:uncharacterized protein YhbP (UPF0306 family)